MRKTIFSLLGKASLFALAFIVGGFFVQSAFAGVWSAPVVAPPDGNPDAPINTSGTPQLKSGGLGVGSLIVDGGAAIGASRDGIGAIISGNVGIGTTGPLAPLQVTSGNSTNSYLLANKNGANAGLITHPVSQVLNATLTAVATGGATVGRVADYLINPSSTWTDDFYGDKINIIVPLAAPAAPHFMWGNSIGIVNASAYSNSVAGSIITVLNNGSAASAGNYYGLQLSASNGSLASNTTMGTAYPLYVGSDNASASATITNQYDIYSYQANSGTIGTRYGLSYLPTNTGTITNAYGLYISGLGTGGTYMNTPYDIYVADSGAYNYFAGNVGIGTTSPSQKLDVAGKIHATGDICTDAGGGLCLTSATGFWSPNGFNDIYNNNPGNIGIGTPSPAGGKLHIFSSGGNDYEGGMAVERSGAASTGRFFVDNNNVLNITRGGGPTVVGRVIALDGAGNVGIGTTTPSQKLDVLGGQMRILDVPWNDLFQAPRISKLVRDGAPGTLVNANSDYAFFGLEPIGPNRADALIEWGDDPAENGVPSSWDSLKFVHMQYNTGERHERMRIDPAGNVGIGTPSPGGTLDVASKDVLNPANNDRVQIGNFINPTNGARSGIQIIQGHGPSSAGGHLYFVNGDSNKSWHMNVWGPSSASPGSFTIVETGVADYRFVVAPGGNVGIGTPTPQALLQVGPVGEVFAAGARAGAYISNPDQDMTVIGMNGTLALRSTDAPAADKGATITLGGAYTGTIYTKFAAIKGAKEDGVVGNYGGYMSFYTRTNGVPPAERMRIDPAGNVGIGTTTPSQKLDVAGRIHATGDICTDAGGGAGKCLSAAGGDGSSFWSSNGFNDIYNNNTGNVGIGTTSPLIKLHVVGDMGATGITYAVGGLVIESRASDPPSPRDGRFWLRSDITPPPSASGKNFFLLSYGAYDGNLLGFAKKNLGYTGTDGLQAADAICLNEVNSHDFIGKPAAKTYVQSEVYAFLCTIRNGPYNGKCRNLLPSTTYVMGRLGSTHGGNMFTTNSTSQGPGDAHTWADSVSFDGTFSYWMSRNEVVFPSTSTLWGLVGNNNYSCYDWTDNSPGNYGFPGLSSASDQARWDTWDASKDSCNVLKNLVCAVDAK